MIPIRRLALVAVFTSTAVLAAQTSAGTPALPPWFPAQLFAPHDVVAEDYAEEAFFVLHPTKEHADNYSSDKYRGRYWWAALAPKNREQWGAHDQGLVLWSQAAKQLTAAGFREVYRHGDETMIDQTFFKADPKHPTYVEVVLNTRDPSRNNVRIIEVGSNPLVVNMKPPASVPEKITDKDDFPFLPPPVPEKLSKTEHDDSPMIYTPASGPKFPVGSGNLMKVYPKVPSISALAAHDAYLDAFRKAGWTIGAGYANEGVYAHYDKNGRDIYARMRHSEGSTFDMFVADVGSELKTTLATKCKASVYGINFDFDKATLRPDSEPTLTQVLRLLKDEPKLTLEIGGHTDNVGKPDYNMKLSDQRAGSVRAWLVAHGIAASRLTSRGYGDTQPLVPNNSDEDRAKNRRVELRKPNCK